MSDVTIQRRCFGVVPDLDMVPSLLPEPRENRQLAWDGSLDFRAHQAEAAGFVRPIFINWQVFGAKLQRFAQSTGKE